MSQQELLPRRKFLHYASVTASTAVLAGCAAQDDTSSDNTENSEETTTDAVGEKGDGGTSDTETESTSDTETENASTETKSASGTWQDVTEIVLDGYTAAWKGVKPKPIAGKDNPTVTLIEGQKYDFTWKNADGQPHNIAIWDADDNQIKATDSISSKGKTQTLTIEASTEMASYICEIHPKTMVADIQVEPGE